MRHPVHEKGRETDFCCTLQEWVVDRAGNAVPMPEEGPFTPAKLVEQGFDLPTILDQLTKQALLDRDAAVSRAEKADTEREKSRAEAAVAVEAKAAAEKLAAMAVEAKAAAERVAANFVEEIQTERAAKASLVAELSLAQDALAAAKEPKSFLSRVGAVFTG